MRLSEALTAETIIVEARWATFEDTVTGLVERLVSCGRLPRELATTAVQRIREREAMASTAMVDVGVSIPHARLDGIHGHVAAAIAVSPTQVYEVADGLPISIVALVLSSPEFTGEHLNFLSALSMLLQSARIRERLRKASSAQEAMEVIRSNEGR